MSSDNTNSKPPPHAVFLPFPLLGHITPFLKLATHFHSIGFSITFINSAFIHRRILASADGASLASLPDFHFETIPDGLPVSTQDAEEITQGILFAVCEATRKKFLDPFRAIIEKLDGVISCIISDTQMPFAIRVAKEIGVPGLSFWTNSACGFMGLKHHKHLKERSLQPLTDEIADTNIDWIPGLKDIRLRDVPFVEICNYDFPMREMEEIFEASGIIFNTFETLEHEVLDAISSMFPHVYPIGPLPNLLNSTSDSGLNSTEEVPQCLQWLDSMKPNSVVYISFGSVAVMKPQQLTEFAWGIANSNLPFLWIIRPNLVIGGPSTLPPELLEKIEGRGLIMSWCPQVKVLNHPSIGGFVTHCGWNSTLDSTCAGVPMICWPWLGDQQINCRYSCAHWGIGMEMDKEVKRDGVEELVRDLMEGDRGKEMKKKVTEWKELAAEATSQGGSSSLSLGKLVSRVLA